MDILKSPDPTVTFFAESKEEATAWAESRGISEKEARGRFFLDGFVNEQGINALKAMRGRVAMALNFNEVQAKGALIECLKGLQSNGIEIDAWVNFSPEHYWLHAGNIDFGIKELEATVNALEQANINIKNLGLDLEFQASIMVGQTSLTSQLKEYYRVAPWKFDRPAAREKLTSYIDNILNAQKYGVHTYEIPIGSDYEFLRKIGGLIEAPDDINDIPNPRYKRIAMVYSSVRPPLISAKTFIRKYAQQKRRIPGLGIITGTDKNPGREMNLSHTKMLSNEDLVRDMQVALEGSNQEVFIFAINSREVIHRVSNALTLAQQAA